MDKDFDQWNLLKKILNSSKRRFFVHPREVWWTSLGLNIGAEIDGKNKNFERPVLILKVYNKDTLLVLPLTQKIKTDRFHQKIMIGQKYSWVKLSQGRVLSTKRLIRKIGLINKDTYLIVLKAWKDHV